MCQQFDYKGVTARPIFVDPHSDQEPDRRILSGWELFKDGEQIPFPSKLRKIEDVKKWIDENVTGTP